MPNQLFVHTADGFKGGFVKKVQGIINWILLSMYDKVDSLVEIPFYSFFCRKMEKRQLKWNSLCKSLDRGSSTLKKQNHLLYRMARNTRLRKKIQIKNCKQIHKSTITKTSYKRRLFKQYVKPLPHISFTNTPIREAARLGIPVNKIRKERRMYIEGIELSFRNTE